MKRLSLMMFSMFTASTLMQAQNIDQGRKYLYYHRYQSAEDVFKRLLNGDQGNIEAVYWLGQTYIQNKDSLAAKELYQKTIAAYSNQQMVLAGMGQVDLLENRLSEARQRFETALELSKQKDLQVFHAVARANIDAPSGDANYALQKLNEIPKRRKKDQKNAETYLLLGKANRKLINGGAAVTALNQALSMDPSLAEAKYEIGKVYLSQNNPDYFLPAFEEAVKIDPNYAPAYYELFFYWFNKDINKARDYFNQYYAVSDKDPSGEYDKTSIIYASRDYQTAIDSAISKVNRLQEKADPRYYKLIAYSYDELNDSLKARQYLEHYFNKQKPAGLVAQDYVFQADILSKFPGNEMEAMKSYETALQLDTSNEGKLKIMNDAAAFASNSGDFISQAAWLGRAYQFKTDPSNRDLYDWGYAHYKAGNYITSDSIFCGIYKQKYPTEIFGYLWCARSAGAQDTSMEKGTAVDPYKNLIAFARASGEREDYKSTLTQAHGYLASYYANIAKDKDSAVVYLENILKLDPDNASAKQYIDVLTKPVAKTPVNARKPKQPVRKNPGK